MNISFTKSLARCALFALLATTGAALADSGTASPTLAPAPVTVRFADVNMDSPEGARIVYARIRSAAQQVCGPSFALWYPGQYRKWKVCYQATVDDAVRKVNRPALTALHGSLASVASR